VTIEPETPPEELERTLADMQVIATKFYQMVFMAGMGTRAHAFVEFTGIMNEYITLCRAAAAEGIDFGRANTHSGDALPVEPHNAAYLAEKLNCIYGPSLLADGDVRDAFIRVLFGGEYTLEKAKKAAKKRGK